MVDLIETIVRRRILSELIGALTNQRFCGSMKWAWDIPRSLRPEGWPTLKGIRIMKTPCTV
jgi:hypothetical protein